jgi:hypothetical protein
LAHADKSVSRDTVAAGENFLTNLTSATVQQMKRYLSEPLEDDRFHYHLDDAGKEPERTEAICANFCKPKVFIKFTIIRAFRPDCIFWGRE